jgi:hypothetical protein
MRFLSTFVNVFVENLLLAARHGHRDCPDLVLRPSPPFCYVCNPADPTQTLEQPGAAEPDTVALSSKLPSILLTNARSLVKKIDTLNGLLEDSKVSLGFITETWFNKDNNSVMRSLISKEYHALSAFRSGRGGGALLLVAMKYASKCSPLEPVYPELPV